MRKYTLYIIVLLGIVAGFFAAFAGTTVMLCTLFVLAAFGIILADYEKATYIIGAYSVIDFVLRSFAPGFASIWDELYLLCLIALWGYKWVVYRKEESFRMTPLDLPVFIFIFVMLFVLIVNSPDFSISVEGFRAVVQYILWYFVAVQLLRTEKGARNLCMCFVLICSVLAVHGVYQYLIGVEMPSGWVDSKEAGVRTRVYSILTSPNIFGSLLTLSAPITVAFAFSAKKTAGKILFSVCALFMAASLVFTFSRGAWIGFAVAACVYVFLKDKRLFIPVIVAGILVVFLVPSVGNRITYMLSPEYIESSLRGGRLVRWITGVEIVESNPFVGVGLGHFGGAVAMNHDLSMLVGINVIKTFYMDNYYLKTAVESGLLGLSAFVMLMYQVVICSIRTVRITVDPKIKELEIGILSGLVGIICHNFVENIFEVPMMMSCFWLMAAVMMNLWYLNFYKKGTL